MAWYWKVLVFPVAAALALLVMMATYVAATVALERLMGRRCPACTRRKLAVVHRAYRECPPLRSGPLYYHCRGCGAAFRENPATLDSISAEELRAGTTIQEFVDDEQGCDD
jgi:hypothetical protein